MRTTIYIHEKVWKMGKDMAEADYRSFSFLITKLITEEAKRRAQVKQAACTVETI